MKRLSFRLVAVAILACLVLPAFAGTTVICNGNKCGGNGPRDYYYDVSMGVSEQFTSFGVGVHDPVLAHYGNQLIPAGWSVAVNVTAGWEQKDDPFHAHGVVSPWSGQCPYTIFWLDTSSNPLQSFGFGFNYNAAPHDTGWFCSGVKENWAMPIGMGQGPVHSPVPEPGPLVVLGWGLIASAGTIMKMRR